MTAPNVIENTPVLTVTPVRRNSPGLLDVLYGKASILAAIAFLVAYARPLMRTLWTDEAGMFWTAHQGPVAAIEKTWHWPGQSILYSVITSFFCFPGSPLRDIFLRLPALLGAAAACYFLYRLAEDSFGAGAGRIAAVLFVFNPLTIEFATQARPYALAMAAAAASCWTLYRWTLWRERRWLAGYVLAVALVFYLHYLFAVILIAHAALLAWEVIAKSRYMRIGELAAGYFIVVLLLLPVLPHMLLMFRESHTFQSVAHVETPGRELAGILLPPAFMAGVFATGLLVHLSFRREVAGRARPSSGLMAMLLVWWLAGPLLLFAISHMTSAELFTTRYVSYSGLALVLLLTYTGYTALGSRYGFVWALLAALLTTGNPLSLAATRGPGEQELGPVMQIVQDESKGRNTLPPVLVRSDYTESDFKDWRAGNTPGSYLYSPFVAYPMNNALLPLPYRLTASVKEYVSQMLGAELKKQDKVIFITHDIFWIAWMDEKFEQAGFSNRWTKPNDYYVGVFERSAGTVQPRDGK